MTSFVYLIEQIQFGLYILCAGGVLFMLYRLQQARHELTVAQFKLERDLALTKRASAITFGGLLVEVMIAVWAISNLMAPTMRDIRLGEDQVSDVEQQAFVTSTPAANPPVSLGGGDLQEDGPDIFATPVPTNTPVGTIIPDAPEPVSCPRDSAWFHIPGNGQLIYEATTAIGTANVSNFSFYRFEIKLQGSDTQFRKFGDDHTEPVVDGPLGEIVPLNLPNGEYRLRLTVFDNTEMLRASCEITIFISDPPLTPTPIGASAATPTPEAS